MFTKEIFKTYFCSPGNAGKDITDEEREALKMAFNEDLIIYTPENKYSSAPYIPVGSYIQKLNEIFGIGNWALVPLNFPEITPRSEDSFYGRVDAVLFIRGKFLAFATGIVSMPEMEHCAEGALSDALKRCAKKIGMFSEIHNTQWIRSFKTRFPRGKLQGHYKQSEKDPGHSQEKQTRTIKLDEKRRMNASKLLKLVNDDVDGYFKNIIHLANALAKSYDIDHNLFEFPKPTELSVWREMFKRARDYALKRLEEKRQEQKKAV